MPVTIYRRRISSTSASEPSSSTATVVEHTEPEGEPEPEADKPPRRTRQRDTSPVNNHWCVRKLW